jgi:hypothetical protein
MFTMVPPFCNVWFVCNFVVVRSMLHGRKHRGLAVSAYDTPGPRKW